MLIVAGGFVAWPWPSTPKYAKVLQHFLYSAKIPKVRPFHGKYDTKHSVQTKDNEGEKADAYVAL